MSKEEMKAFAPTVESANKALSTTDENTILAITAAFLAGKESGKREAQEEKPQ